MLLLNLLISIIVLIFYILMKEKTKGLLLFIFIILCPFISVAFLFLSWIMNKLFYSSDLNMKELSFDSERLQMIVGPDYQKEINTVSVEEALMVSDMYNKRRVILDVLKEDYNNSLTVISNALENEDSETSHYVATIIADVKSNFKITVQKMYESLKEYPNDMEISTLLINYIYEFIEKNVLSEIEELTYVQQNIQLMEDLYHHNRSSITSKMYKNLVDILLKVDNSDKGMLWAERCFEQYPDDLNSFKGLLKLYYTINDSNKFFQALNGLKSSKTEFDNEVLELVRFYQT